MNEIRFVVDETTDGGLIAHAVGASIFTEADDLISLRRQINDAVQCHFYEGNVPQRIILC